MGMLVFQQEEAIEDQLKNEELEIEAKLDKIVKEARHLIDEMRREVESNIDQMANRIVTQKKTISSAAELNTLVAKMDEQIRYDDS